MRKTMTKTKIEWAKIPSFEDYYVSRNGKILSTKMKTPRILKPIKSKSGHLYVFLYKNSKMFKVWVHRAVLITFNRFPKSNEECRHLDGNPENNYLTNITWGTRMENVLDRWEHGTMPLPHESKFTKLTPEDIPLIQNMKNKKSSRAVAKIFKTSHTTIQKIWRNERWKGYANYGNHQNRMV